MVVADSARITFREMYGADLDTVMQIEFRSYAFPWSTGIFRDCLRAGYDCRVMCVDGEIVGHAITSVGAGEAHLLNVCIRRDLQGRGFGRLFVRQVLRRAELLGAARLFLEVRPSNRIAVVLYESLGFAQIGVRENYYPSEAGREDALVFAIELAE